MAPQTQLGIFTTDVDLIIRSWDDWMARTTGTVAADAIGKHIKDIVVDFESRHLEAYFTRSVHEGVIEILAPRFHGYLIPCPPTIASRRFEYMQQKVTIAPLEAEGLRIGLIVTVEDTTGNDDREHDENLVEAFDNSNWALRRDATNRLAQQGSQTAITSLLRVLREQHRNLNVLNSALRVLTASGLDTTKPLVELLQDSDPEVRMYAALALGDAKSRGAVPALRARLKDSDNNVRYHVIEALAKIQAPEAANDLLEIVQSGDFFLAFPAIDALACLHDPHIAVRLVPLLEDEMVRGAVVAALGSLGDERVVQPLAQLLNRPGRHVSTIAQALASLHDRFHRRYGEGAYIADLIRLHTPAGAVAHVIEALNGADTEGLRSLVKLLSWLESADIAHALTELLGSEQVRKEVIEALVRHGKDMTGALIGKLNSDDIEIRRAAIIALGRIGDPRCAPELIAVLTDDPELGASAANALAKIGDARAYDALIDLLGNNNPAVRQAAIGAINSLGDTRTETDILRLISHDNPHVRESAIRICGYFGYNDCAPLLFEKVNDPDESVRRAAIESLPYLSHPSVPQSLLNLLADRSAGVRATAAQALGSIDEHRTTLALISALDDTDPWVRYYASRSLGRLRIPDAVDKLAANLKSDPATHVRIASAEALAAIGGAKAAHSLSSVLQSTERDLSSAAAKALAAIGDPDALPPLLEMLHSTDRNRRLDAVRALGTRTDQEVVRALEWLAASEQDSEVAVSAIRGLATMRSTEAVSSVVRLTAQASIRETCIAELSKADNSYLENIAAGLLHPQTEVRRAVVEALSRKKHPKASELLARALDDDQPSIRLTAIAALSRLGSHIAERKLAMLVSNDPDDAVRNAAQEALQR